MEYPNARILIFAKPPVSGHCKTRLGKGTGMRRAAAIHAQLLEKTVAMSVSTQLAPVYLYCDRSTGHTTFQRLRRHYCVHLRRQSAGDLGTRMLNGLKATIHQRAMCLIIGSDCPALTAAHLRACLADLAAGQDAVLIPSMDGGYALIGMKEALPQLFRHIPWGSPQVLALTRRRLQQACLNWTEFEPLEDIDDIADYKLARKAYLL